MRGALAAPLPLAASSGAGQDATRDAAIYLQLPAGQASCVSCHGPDPTQNRNRLLFAADLAVWPATVEFGRIAPGATAPEHRVDLLNRGQRTQTLASPRFVGGAFVLRHDCPAALAQGSGCAALLEPAGAASGQTSGALFWTVPADAAPLMAGGVVDARAGASGVLESNPSGPIDFGNVAARNAGCGFRTPAIRTSASAPSP